MREIRPKDLCTAAFFDDVQRIRQLISAALPRGDEKSENGEEAMGEEEEDEEVGEMNLAIRRLEKKKKRREAVAALLADAGLLCSVETGEQCGFSFRVEERNDDYRLQLEFKASRRSKYPATPLHWAALGRSHDAVEFLVKNGADVRQEVPHFSRATAAFICRCNNSWETLKRLEKASADYGRLLRSEEHQKRKLMDGIEKKKRERERLAELEEQEEAEAGAEEEGVEVNESDDGGQVDDDDGDEVGEEDA